MFKLHPARLAVYALVSCLTNLQFAHAQDITQELNSAESTSTESLELPKPKMVKRVRPIGYNIPVDGELLLSTSYLYGDSSFKGTSGVSATSSLSNFTINSAYGFSKNFYVGLNLSVQQSVTKVKFASLSLNGEKTSTTEGLNNPELTFAFQLPRNPITFIAGVDLSIKAEEATSEEDSKGERQSNASSGGNSLKPFIMAHTNSRTFMYGGRLSYAINDKRTRSESGSSSVQVYQAQTNSYLTQSVATKSTYESTGGNTTYTALFMQLPRFYNLGLNLGYSQSESTESVNSSTKLTTKNDGSNFASVAAFASFSVLDSMSLVPILAYGTQTNKPNSVESSSTIFGGLNLGLNF